MASDDSTTPEVMISLEITLLARPVVSRMKPTFYRP